MLQYTIRRLLLGVVTGLLVSLLVFAILRIAPGDVVDSILGEEGDLLPESVADELREMLGLNEPLHMQYLFWIRDFATLRWGTALVDGLDIWGQVKQKLPITLQLSVMAIVLSVILGIPAGIIMALKQDTWIDYVVRISSLAALSIPNFWIGTMIVLLGAMYFEWSPQLEYVSFVQDPVANMGIFFWPALAAGLAQMATKARMMRSTMLEVLRQDYIRTAHAKGLRYFVVITRHAMKNAFLPVVTIIGLSVAATLGGSVIMEQIFLIPGMGRYLVKSLGRADYPVVQTLVLFLSFWIVLSNLVVDLTYGWLDPRIRY
jgi:peptide/nickel transport system permease protein